MGYRDEEAALRSKRDALRQALETRAKEEAEVRAALVTSRSSVAALRARLEEAGPGSGRRGWRKDRVDVAAWFLVIVGLIASALHIEWHRYIARDPSVIPAILWLGVPGLLAAAVAFPYAKVSGRCLFAGVLGLLIAALPFLNLAVGFR